VIAPDVIRRIADEVIGQITMGCKAYRAGDSLNGELHLSLANVALLKLQRLLDAPERPIRKLCLVGDRAPVDPGEADLPAWFHTKTNSEDPDAA
jgi:hypothetical protein